MGEDRRLATEAAVEGVDLPLRGEGGLLEDLDVGGEAAFADKGAGTGFKGAIRSGGLNLFDAADRQADVVEAPVAIDLDRDPRQLRRDPATGGGDPSANKSHLLLPHRIPRPGLVS